jgi:hypothetical protein
MLLTVVKARLAVIIWGTALQKNESKKLLSTAVTTLPRQ